MSFNFESKIMNMYIKLFFVRLFSTVLFLSFGINAFSQSVVLVPFSGSNSVSGCTNVTLQDHAGSASYNDNANGHTILNASGSQTINISGTYSTESCCDRIRIYNGSGVSGTLLATYQGSGSVNYTGTAGQTLTVQFTSDGSVTDIGFDFSVTYSGCFSGPVPTISSFSPSSGSCNTVVTINGTNFDNGTPIVKFNGVTASHTYINATQLTATVPAGATTGAITVQTGGGIATSSTNFTVNTSSPTISSVSSSSGTRGTVITITGTNLTCPSAVTFGGTAAFSFNATSSTSITAEVGYGSSGNIAVTTAGGTATFAGFTYTAPAAANTVNIQGTTTTNTITNNQASIVDNGLIVSSNGLISGFIVTITDSYQSGDVLAYNTSTGGALPAGISVAAFNTTTRSLVFSGSAIAADWQRILRNVTLTTTSAVCSPESRKVAFIAGDVFYNPLNGHFYKTSTSSTSWTNAKTNAQNMSYFGKQGYLATITSQAENSFISRLVGINSWIGCSDRFSEINSALGYTLYPSSGSSVTIGGVTYTGNNNNGNAEGNWFWVTGPEKGTRLRNGNATNIGASNNFGVGSAVSGVYQNWQSNEPNDHSASNFGDEDYGHIFGSGGEWNDYPESISIGSVIEFGDMPGDNTSGNINTVFTRNIYINGAPSGTITGGNINVCSGSNSTTLTLTGLASGGTVTRWEYSLDNFLTAGTNVSSTSTSLTVSNISETRYYRVIVSASGCTGLATSSTRIGVATTTAGSIVSNKSAICTGGSTELTLSGNIGSVVRWERSTSSTFASGVTSISNTTTKLTETLNTAGTYYYRAVVQQSGCGSAVNTNGYPVTVTAGSPPVGGTISSSSSCSGTNNITLTLSGHSGNITKWQFSTDGGFVWNDINHTASTLTQTNITSNRLYRAIVSTSNQACGNESSSSGEVTVFGTTVVRWDGTNSKNSKTLANWCGGIPNNGQDVVISATAANDLMLEDNKILGSIDFNGSSRIIELGNFDLQVSEIKGIGASNYIKTNGTGQLKMNLPPNTPTTFLVGNSAQNRVVITNKNNASDVFGVRVLDEVYADGLTGNVINAPRIRRTWDISKTNANASGGVDFTFHWNAGEAQNLTSGFRLYHFGSSWDLQSGTPTVSGNSLTYTGYTGSFSPFAIGSDVTPLPVTLSSFKAICNAGNTTLSWSTAQETNNAFFTLKTSVDGEVWNSIAQIPSRGDAFQTQHYSFEYKSPANNAFYQLSQTDIDGTTKTFPVIFTSCLGQNNSNQLATVYPVPSTGNVTVALSQPARLQLFDVNGRLVHSLSSANNIELNNLAKGLYLLRVVSENLHETHRIIIE